MPNRYISLFKMYRKMPIFSKPRQAPNQFSAKMRYVHLTDCEAAGQRCGQMEQVACEAKMVHVVGLGGAESGPECGGRVDPPGKRVHIACEAEIVYTAKYARLMHASFPVWCVRLHCLMLIACLS